MHAESRGPLHAEPHATVAPARWRRWARAVAVVAVVAGFGAAVAYVYYYVTRDGALGEGGVPVIRADQVPFRVRPDNPGGIDVPHQDVEILNRLAQPAGQQPRTPPRPERVVPSFEPPLPRGVAVTQVTAPAAPARPGAAPAAPAAAPAPRAPGPRTPPAAPEPAAQVAAAGATGTARVQLGALVSETLATQEMQRLQRLHAAELRGIPLAVSRGQRPGGDAVFRIRSAPLRDRATAAALCERLRERRVSCIVAP